MNWMTLPHTLSPGIVPLFAIVLTLGAYLFGVEIQKRLRNPLANPVLIAIVIIGVTLHLLHLSYQDYFTGAQFIHFLLGPATVALAIPMVRALEHMRRGFWPMMSALLAGSLIGLISGYASFDCSAAARPLRSPWRPNPLPLPSPSPSRPALEASLLSPLSLQSSAASSWPSPSTRFSTD